MAAELRYYVEIESEMRAIYGEWDQPLPEPILKNAQKIHALIMRDATLDATFRALELSSLIVDPRAHYMMRFGVLRRLQMIWYAYSDLVSTVPPSRNEPLQDDESPRVTQNLNAVYINIRGTLDNLAAALLYNFDPDKFKSIKSSGIGLFYKCIVDNSTFHTITHDLKKHDSWNSDLKARRDPAARRIPLAVVRTQLNPEEASAYRDFDERAGQARARRAFDEFQQIFEEQQQLGTFRPVFMHDPADGWFEIYPTVPDDLTHLVEVFRVIEQFFRSALGNCPTDP